MKYSLLLMNYIKYLICYTIGCPIEFNIDLFIFIILLVGEGDLNPDCLPGVQTELQAVRRKG